MKKVLYFIGILILLVIIVYLFYPKNNEMQDSSNIICVSESDCPKGLVCSSYSSKCVESIQDEQMNRLTNISNSNKEILNSGLNNISLVLKSNYPSECGKLNNDGNVKNPYNNPMILVPGKKTCYVLLALKTKNQSICSYLDNIEKSVDFESLPDLRNYPDLNEYTTFLTNAKEVIRSGNSIDCINLVKNN